MTNTKMREKRIRQAKAKHKPLKLKQKRFFSATLEMKKLESTYNGELN